MVTPLWHRIEEPKAERRPQIGDFVNCLPCVRPLWVGGQLMAMQNGIATVRTHDGRTMTAKAHYVNFVSSGDVAEVA